MPLPGTFQANLSRLNYSTKLLVFAIDICIPKKSSIKLEMLRVGRLTVSLQAPIRYPIL